MLGWYIVFFIVLLRWSSNCFQRKEIRKVAFLAVCQGEQLAVRMHKICSGFRANTYPCPNTYRERMELMEKLEIRLSDLNQVMFNERGNSSS